MSYRKTDLLPKSMNSFYNAIIRWYQASEIPEVLIDDIMKDYQPEDLRPYQYATPETTARVLMRNYAIEHELVYHATPQELKKRLEKRFDA